MFGPRRRGDRPHGLRRVAVLLDTGAAPGSSPQLGQFEPLSLRGRRRQGQPDCRPVCRCASRTRPSCCPIVPVLLLAMYVHLPEGPRAPGRGLSPQVPACGAALVGPLRRRVASLCGARRPGGPLDPPAGWCQVAQPSGNCSMWRSGSDSDSGF